MFQFGLHELLRRPILLREVADPTTCWTIDSRLYGLDPEFIKGVSEFPGQELLFPPGCIFNVTVDRTPGLLVSRTLAPATVSSGSCTIPDTRADQNSVLLVDPGPLLPLASMTVPGAVATGAVAVALATASTCATANHRRTSHRRTSHHRTSQAVEQRSPPPPTPRLHLHAPCH
mmetsp:Transcript_67041/g.158194  ORF Transcript_67041/g.158194 Transcript_67041/m.158194 type:complete len:174 (-) Transcript_67041:485-1006(-)